MKIHSNNCQYIVERLMLEDMTLINASNTKIQLENLYTIVKFSSEDSPWDAVDQPWHTHILNKLIYFEFTNKFVGKYLQHVPF